MKEKFNIVKEYAKKVKSEEIKRMKKEGVIKLIDIITKH